MAKWSFDCSVIPILPPTYLSKALLSTSFPYSFIPVTSSSSFTYGKLIIINCSKSTSPLLEDSSSDNLQIIQSSSTLTTQQQQHISNEFIQGLCKDPQTQLLAFSCYQKAKNQPNFRPEQPTLNLLTTSLSKSKQWSSIASLSEDFTDYGVYPSRVTSGRLIASCIRARKLKLVQTLLRVFETEKGTAVFAFGSAMRGYNKLHMYTGTVLVFDRMRAAGISPSARCYFWIMDAYRKLGDSDKVFSLFLEFESKNFNVSTFTVHIYSVLCDSLGKSGRAFKALRYFREMVANGIPPIPAFYASLIRSFAGIREAEIAEDLFHEAKQKGMVKDPVIFLKLVLMYVDLGLMEKTIEVVVAMKDIRLKVSDCILCAVVNGYASKRGIRASLRAYEQLKSLNCEFGQVTYASVINVFCRLGLSHKAEALFAEMMDKGFNKCVVAYSNMISMYGKVGRVKDAMRLLVTMKENGCEPNVWVYNSLLDIHGRLLNLKQVDKLWKEMKRREIDPDRISYTSIISAYSKAREFEECLRFYREFKMNGGKLDRVLAGIMVGVFSKNSRINELVMLLKDLKSNGTELDARLYKSSLNALRDAGLQANVSWLEQNFKIEKG